jgi:hypothetical protein
MPPAFIALCLSAWMPFCLDAFGLDAFGLYVFSQPLYRIFAFFYQDLQLKTG